MPIRKSRVSGIVASGTTADRPTNPSIGDTFFNGTLGVQEIYTDSGWLPATGANDFNIVLSGSETSVTLDKEYFAGAYTITSALSDTAFDVYLFDTSNNLAGYSNSPSINATSNFNKIIIYGGTNQDLLSFAYKTTFATSATTTDTFAAPYVISISVADLPNIDDTTTITGGNFDTDVEVWFDGQNNYSSQAKSVVYGSPTSIVVTRPDDLLEDNAPYTIRVVNPGTTSPSGSNRNKLIDSVTAGGDPVWSTPAGNIFRDYHGSPLSFNLAASDESDITYTITSGTLPSGLSLNSSTGEISGNSTETESIYKTFTVQALDQSGNASSRSFSMGKVADGGTVSVSGSYTYHTFTSSSTFQTLVDNLNIDILVVAGGGAGGGADGTDVGGGGGGAGGYQSFSLEAATPYTYPVTVGAGAAGPTGFSAAVNGSNSKFGGLADSIGGGGGGTWENPPQAGGSGGGAGENGQSHSGGFGTSGQGNPGGDDGGYVSNGFNAGGGGGGAGSAGLNITSSSQGGNGGAGLQWLDGNYYAGGGGGSGSSVPGTGGVGGGANGAGPSTSNGNAGAANTGGGGGGANWNGSGNGSGGNTGGNGGSGIVIVRYAA